MQLTKWTDYSLRVLMYCAAHAGRGTPVTIAEIERAHGISRSHLQKVVMSLAALGYLETTRGRGGGLRLLAPASETRVGEVIRHTETDFTLLECFDPLLNTCSLAGRCRLESVLHEAMVRFLEALDGVTLADLSTPGMRRLPLAPLPVSAQPRRQRAGTRQA
ncbi:MAG: Rrf2 family transcriptional regulator [Rubrivivax sp.]|nr:Rrf2 family transcriptional regulator [Rubrivivax sp.]